MICRHALESPFFMMLSSNIFLLSQLLRLSRIQMVVILLLIFGALDALC